MDKQQLIQAGTQILQRAQQGDTEAQQIVQAAQDTAQDPQQLQALEQAVSQGDEQALPVYAVLVAAQSAQMAKLGAKLNYIQRLRGECPEGYEMQYFKKGGQMCQKCVQKVKAHQPGGEMNAIEEFKCGRKMKKKAACGTKIEAEKCGGKAKKKACGGAKLPMNKCGDKVLVKKCGGKQVKKKANGGSFIPFPKRGLN